MADEGYISDDIKNYYYSSSNSEDDDDAFTNRLQAVGIHVDQHFIEMDRILNKIISGINDLLLTNELSS